MAETASTDLPDPPRSAPISRKRSKNLVALHPTILADGERDWRKGYHHRIWKPESSTHQTSSLSKAPRPTGKEAVTKVSEQTSANRQAGRRRYTHPPDRDGVSMTLHCPLAHGICDLEPFSRDISNGRQNRYGLQTSTFLILDHFCLLSDRSPFPTGPAGKSSRALSPFSLHFPSHFSYS